MDISSEITFWRNQINVKNRQIEVINKKINKLEKIEEKFPGIKKTEGLHTSAAVKPSDITCMSLDHKYDFRNHTKTSLVARFAASPTKNDNLKIHLEPLNHLIATIETNYTSTYTYKNSSKRTIKILIADYESAIPIDINKRKFFIKRIKRKLKDFIVDSKAEIHPDSFNKEYFEKMLMLV